MGTVKGLFVKKYISEKEWREDYQLSPSYYHLGKDDSRKKDRVKVGFLVIDNSNGKPPVGCEVLTDSEALNLDDQRRTLRNYPFVTSNL